MKKDSKVNQAKYVELNLFPEEIEDYQKDSISSESKESHTSSDKEYDLTDLFISKKLNILRYFRWMVCVLPRMPVSTAIPLSRISTFSYLASTITFPFNVITPQCLGICSKAQ